MSAHPRSRRQLERDKRLLLTTMWELTELVKLNVVDENVHNEALMLAKTAERDVTE